MSIELTREQSEALEGDTGPSIAVMDPRTQRAYRLVPIEVYQRIERILSDESAWTSDEMAILASRAFSKLDDTDYSHYLADRP